MGVIEIEDKEVTDGLCGCLARLSLGEFDLGHIYDLRGFLLRPLLTL